MKSFGLLTLAALSTALLSSHEAHAASQKVWVQTDGCATQLAVSGNDVPWVLDCDAVGSVYFRGSKSAPCSGGGLCLSTPAWIYAGGSGSFIAVGVDSGPAVVDKKGALWIALWSSNTGALRKPDKWVKPPTLMPGGQSACIQSLAQGTVLSSLWAIGCGGNPDAPIWQLAPVWSSSVPISQLFVKGTNVWHQLGAQYANAGTQVAVFNAIGDRVVNQNPWVVAGGSVWAYNGSYFDWVPAPFDGQVTAVTDHHIVSAGSVYRWNGNIYGGGGGSTPWTLEIGATPGAPIKQIAWTMNRAGGSSNLWAIDTAGGIYYEWTTSEPR